MKHRYHVYNAIGDATRIRKVGTQSEAVAIVTEWSSGTGRPQDCQIIDRAANRYVTDIVELVRGFQRAQPIERAEV